MEVWTTVACSKTRAALDGLQRAGERYSTRSCLDQPPTPAEVHDVLARLGAEPWDLAREKESAEAGFADLPRDADHRDGESVLGQPTGRGFQRPIILLDDGTAVVARDAETLDRVLGT